MFTKTTSRKIRILGVDVLTAEVRQEWDSVHNTSSGTERRRNPGNGVVEINPILVTPVIAEAYRRSMGMIPQAFSFGGISELEVDGNSDIYSAVQGLKDIFQYGEATRVIFGTVALSSAYSDIAAGSSGHFLSQIAEVVKENWETRNDKE